MREIEILDPEGYKIFVSNLQIVKENYHNKVSEGNECSKILKNLDFLKQCVVMYEQTCRIIETLEAIKSFIATCCSKIRGNSWKKSIENVSRTWSHLHQKYGTSIPNKVHIIIDHVKDYMEKTGFLIR